jgi:hypothetical protein
MKRVMLFDIRGVFHLEEFVRLFQRPLGVLLISLNLCSILFLARSVVFAEQTAMDSMQPELLNGANYAERDQYAIIAKELKKWHRGNTPKKVGAILEGGPGPDRDRLISDMNRMLTLHKLPTISNSAALKMKRSCVTGIRAVENCFNGLEINDGVNVFCFGCEVNYNQFANGIRRHNWAADPEKMKGKSLISPDCGTVIKSKDTPPFVSR